MKQLENSETVYIKPGEYDGVKVGMEFSVYDPGEQLIDPDLGINLANDEKYIGKIRVTELLPNGKAARCDVLEGKRFQPGYIVRRD